MKTSPEGIIFLLIINVTILLSPTYQSPGLPTPATVPPKTTFRSCANKICLETDTVTSLIHPSILSKDYLDQVCPHGKYLPRIIGDQEQKTLVSFMATLPSATKYYAPLGLSMRYLKWTDVIKNKSISLPGDKSYLMAKLSKITFEVQALTCDCQYPFGCVLSGPCKPTKAINVYALAINIGCLYVINSKMTYYDSINSCATQYPTSNLLSFSVLSTNQKVISSFPADVKELWLAETRISLSWTNNAPVVYTRWKPGYPKDKAIFAYMGNSDKYGTWTTFQNGDSTSYDDDGDAYIAVCAYKDKDPSSPTVKSEVIDDTNAHLTNLVKVGMGVGIGCCLLFVVSIAIAIVVCLRLKKKRMDQKPQKTLSMGTISSTASSIGYNFDPGYNNYVTRNNDDDNNFPTTSFNELRNNQHFSYERTNILGPSTTVTNSRSCHYEDIRPYEIPDNAPIVEHVYNAMRQHQPQVYAGSLLSLASTTPQPSIPLPQIPQQQQYMQQQKQLSQYHSNYLQMKNPYLDLIA